MIQIDDAGSGSLIGGTCIGAMRVETGQYVYDYIPIDLYQNGNFHEKHYLSKSRDIVIDLLSFLGVSPKEEILICRGYMFEVAREYLADSGYQYRDTKILDPLQGKIEGTFSEHVLSLGVPVQYVKYTRYPLHFHRLLRWVYADYRRRHKLCKTDWRSFQRYGNLDIDISWDVLFHKNYTCLRCGKRILPGTKVVVLKYISNCPNTIYLHRRCNPA